MEATTITTLEALRDALNGVPQWRDYGADIRAWRDAVKRYAAATGLPWGIDGVAHSDLPLFGGETPRDTLFVWSWDAENLLVHDGTAWRIVPRGESEGGAS